MITAAEARNIAAGSNKAADLAMVEVEKKIREAAEKGEKLVVLYVDKLWFAETNYAYTTNIKGSVLQQRVIEKLKAVGFNAKVEADGVPHVPLSHQNDYGDATEPLYQNFCIVVRW